MVFLSLTYHNSKIHQKTSPINKIALSLQTKKNYDTSDYNGPLCICLKNYNEHSSQAAPLPKYVYVFCVLGTLPNTL